MFLALKEIKYEKLRYGLITFMIFLIAFLIYMLSSLAVGLASENTQAVESWKTQSVVLNKNSNINLAQSVLTSDQVKKSDLGSKEAFVGETPVVVKHKGNSTVSAQFIGLDKDQYIYKNLELTQGKKVIRSHEVVVDKSFANKGYKVGDKISLNGEKTKYKIAGFVNNAKINIAPIVYGELSTWKKIRPLAPNAVASGIISQNSNFKLKSDDVKTYKVKAFIKKLPGYTAQNLTFALMIGFLFVISLIIIAVFLYILTMQKMPNYSVLRAQGIPTKTLVGATISQSLILTFVGSVLALIVMLIMVQVMPSAVPIEFAPWIMASGLIGMIITGVIGGLIPIRSIMKVDPVKAIG
ncbi:putative ABC transport system permease protein [Lactobacillus colini]|uniref:Putative hemin transport system permease protein HrtB n=1 Tax=Lactobacillus colini TaxID=1819254 RepID=A0ABS4MEQ4_9LACO|nr:ABC transporter permease [Lactobacillus colini]MBP2058167.1 putative ABC transport system permease protein [Lactobacillus colini]